MAVATDQPPETIIRCSAIVDGVLCDNVLGVKSRDEYTCRMTRSGKRREIVYRDPVRITCEDCGAVWVPGQD